MFSLPTGLRFLALARHESILVICLLLPVCGTATAAPVPDEVLWMLEDMYGQDRGQWPEPLLQQDINADGMPDWVAVTRGCAAVEDCETDVFLCKQAAQGGCMEYCYAGSGLYKILRANTALLTCRPTC